MKISSELITQSYQFINPMNERQIDIKGHKIALIENLGATLSFGDSLPALENLMLTNNRIAELQEIDNLSSCTNLQRMSLINNPVSQLKNYRVYVISRIPSLKVLDFQKVKQKEREEAKRIAEEDAAKKKKEFKALDKKQKIKIAIEKATTAEELNRLELLLKTGEFSESLFDEKFQELTKK